MKVKTITQGNRQARIGYDEDLDEYLVQLFVGGKRQKGADYFTPDRDDALGTAALMVAPVAAAS
jgi:hypothetical protein